ncbi:DNA mismatch repair protein [Chryseobacterium sp. Ch-15]|uniref:DNA mismatch repair protein n=1 Tax=Chryseobacterium muglaense TaxID=2893752 RepID=A0A9Q3YRW9_9FLAO|nr:Smr/MutS family protein [Chryseobacterium muglaense]MBD3903587.1 DNA mismatch repair protein [Chryseobacterium muglaense]MCC9034658.1 DNA mismatch repair protein [Chryseobacterium muglaense]MCM2552921.1 DNA mismatch repair protein [Chryseobacterium muglaense]
MKIGNKVSVVDEDLSGVITSVNGNIVVFKDEYGFTYQYPKEKLVPKDAEIYENIKIIKKAEPRKTISKKHDKNPLILDLHFENLVKNPHDYDSFERLFLQKEKLIHTISFCRKNHLKKLEIVHGIGDGTLQRMVFDVLESQTGLDFYNKEILHHQSGAVMVEFH